MARQTDEPIVQKIYDMKHEYDQKITSLEQDLLKLEHVSDVNYKLLSQSLSTEIAKQSEHYAMLKETIEDLEADIERMKEQMVEYQRFDDKIATAWKAVAIVASVIATVAGSLYTLGKDIGDLFRP